MEVSEKEKEVKEAKPVRAPGITWHKIGYQILKDNLIEVRPSDIDDLEKDAEEWWNSEETKTSRYGKILHQVLGHWATKTLMLIGNIFANNWFYNWMNTANEPDEDEDEDEDDNV